MKIVESADTLLNTKVYKVISRLYADDNELLNIKDLSGSDT